MDTSDGEKSLARMVCLFCYVGCTSMQTLQVRKAILNVMTRLEIVPFSVYILNHGNNSFTRQ